MDYRTSFDLNLERDVRHMVITEKEVCELPLRAARELRERWIEPMTRELRGDGRVTIDGYEIEDAVQHIARQDESALEIYRGIRFALRCRDEAWYDRVAVRLQVFNAL